MNLSPTELERLTIFTAAEFARRNIRSGIPLSHPEAVAFITDEAMLMARAGVSYTEIRHLSTRLLTPTELEPGVAGMLQLIMIELPMAEGTKLLALFDPVNRNQGELIPGDVTTDQHVEGRQARRSTPQDIEIDIVNGGDRDIQIRSMTHLFEVNKALRFDRRSAYGMRLAIPAGSGIRFEPGVVKRVPLTPIAGDRIVLGHAGLVDGQLDDAEVRARALQQASAQGYMTEVD
jgi:urease subunit gamma/beta